MEYRIYLVQNGSRTVFFNGINNSKKPFADSDCRVWWNCDTEEEALAKFHEFAEEEADKENHIDETDEQRQKFIDDCMNARCIEWDNDLKWLHIAKCDDDGEIVEIL